MSTHRTPARRRRDEANRRRQEAGWAARSGPVQVLALGTSAPADVPTLTRPERSAAGQERSEGGRSPANELLDQADGLSS